MPRAAIVHPKTLIARELRDRLAQDRGPWESLRLLSTDEAEIGDVTDGLDGAAFIAPATADELTGEDVVFFCGPIARQRQLLAELPPDVTAIVLSPDAGLADGTPLVHGVSTPAARGAVYLSPHPAVVALAHLLAPLRSLGLAEATATVIQPISLFEEAALEAIFTETKALLTFSAPPEPVIFGRQLAFNLLPARDQDGVGELLQTVLDSGPQTPPVAVQVIQGGVYHGLSISLWARLRPPANAERLTTALLDGGFVRLPDDTTRPLLGPLDAPDQDHILLGPLHADPRRAGGYWLWAVMDNLTRGGALNALGIAADLLER
jgi:aspartate-semialdehyde dehydrogenase